MGRAMATHGNVAAKETCPNWARDVFDAFQLTNGHRLDRAINPVRMFYAAEGGLEILSSQTIANLAECL